MASSTTADETNGTTSPDSWIDDEEEIALEDDVDNDEENDDDAHYADDDDSDANENGDNDGCGGDGAEHRDLYGLNNVVEQIINLEIASADCATGYLISNTTLGNLLQPQEVPLTDNFVVSDSDLPAQDDCNDNVDVEMPTTSAKAFTSPTQQSEQQYQGRQEQQQGNFDKDNQDNNNSLGTTASISLQDSEISLSLQSSTNNPSNSLTTQSRRRRYSDLQQTCIKHHRHHHHHHHRHHHHHSSATTTTSSVPLISSTTNRKHHSSQSHHHSSSSSSHCAAGSRHHRLHSHHSHHHRRPHRHGGDKHEQSSLQCDECSINTTKEEITMSNSKATTSLGLDIETPSSSSSLLDDNKTIIRSGGRMKFK